MRTRRNRHLHVAKLGCQIALLGRYVTGVAVGAAVQTWPAAPGTTIDAAQATLGNRPTLGAINGEPALVFDGVDDVMDFSAGGAALTNGQSSCMITAVCVVDAVGDATQIAVWIGTGTVTSNARMSLRVYSASANQVSASGRRLDADASAPVSGVVGDSAVPVIASNLCDWAGNTVRAVASGVESTTSAFTSGAGTQSPTNALSARVGGLSAGSSRLKGRVGAVYVACPIPSAAVRKRLRFHLGYTFRVPSS